MLFQTTHDKILNYIYSLYYKGIIWGDQLCNLGYDGFPDPLFRDDVNNTEFTPDFVAIGKEGDAQIIDVKSFENIETYFPNEQIEDKIEDTINNVNKYKNVTPEMIKNYLSYRDIDYTPEIIEVVIVIPQDVYEKYSTTIIDSVEHNELILWLIDDNYNRIWKEYGKHHSKELNEKLEKGVRPYPYRSDFILYFRNTDRRIIKYIFIERLIIYCARENKKEFSFDEIDSIMTEIDPPILSHLLPMERERIWRECLYSMLKEFNLIRKSKSAPNNYEWVKEALLRNPMVRSSELTKICKRLKLCGD